MAKDLDRMSFRELQELELKLKKAKASAEDRTRAEVRSKVEALIASAGFKVSDIFGGRGGKGRTVTGRGRKPRWLAAKLKGGDRMEKFLIK
jgi:DNA-binding protein H-NS